MPVAVDDHARAPRGVAQLDQQVAGRRGDAGRDAELVAAARWRRPSRRPGAGRARACRRPAGRRCARRSRPARRRCCRAASPRSRPLRRRAAPPRRRRPGPCRRRCAAACGRSPRPPVRAAPSTSAPRPGQQLGVPAGRLPGHQHRRAQALAGHRGHQRDVDHVDAALGRALGERHLQPRAGGVEVGPERARRRSAGSAFSSAVMASCELFRLSTSVGVGDRLGLAAARLHAVDGDAPSGRSRGRRRRRRPGRGAISEPASPSPRTAMPQVAHSAAPHRRRAVRVERGDGLQPPGLALGPLGGRPVDRLPVGGEHQPRTGVVQLDPVAGRLPDVEEEALLDGVLVRPGLDVDALLQRQVGGPDDVVAAVDGEGQVVQPARRCRCCPGSRPRRSPCS